MYFFFPSDSSHSRCKTGARRPTQQAPRQQLQLSARAAPSHQALVTALPPAERHGQHAGYADKKLCSLCDSGHKGYLIALGFR